VTSTSASTIHLPSPNEDDLGGDDIVVRDKNGEYDVEFAGAAAVRETERRDLSDGLDNVRR
jgi:hypothetical protein